MRSIFIGLLGLACYISALFIVSRVAARTHADPPRTSSQETGELSELQIDNGLGDPIPVIRATRRTSIPFGFDTPLPLELADQEIRASGEGACTANESVTVAVTITQAATGATAQGETVAPCTGQLQMWSATATAAPGPPIAPGTANACGVATTRAYGEVTDVFEWCRDVALRAEVYLPLVSRP